MDFILSLSNPVTVVAVVILLSLWFSRIRRQRRGTTELKPPPEVPGGWPLIGHLLMLGGPEPPHRALGAMADKCGPIFTIRLGQRPALIVSNSEMVKECFGENDASIFARPQTLATKLLTYDSALFAFSANHPFWREMRKITTLELLSNRRLELLKHVRITEVETWISEMHNFCIAGKGKDSSEKVIVEMKEWFSNLTFNVILKVLVGKRCFGSMDKADEEEARRFRHAQDEFFRYLGMFLPADAIPFLTWFDFGGHQKGMKKTAKEMDSILEGWLEEHKRRRLSGVSENDKDFMDVMLSTLDCKNLHGYDTDTIIKATILGVIAAATDTSTVTLTWATSLLLNNPRTLKKAKKEIDEEIGQEKAVTESDVGKLVYIQAIVKEALRLYPPGPLTPSREFIEDCIIAGYHVKKGTRLFPNVPIIQTDPKVWPDPMEFKPERFLTTHKDVDARGKHYELIPFGSGRRICPGINFALQVVPFILARFLQAFDIETPSNETVDMTESTAFANMKVTPLEVHITPRPRSAM